MVPMSMTNVKANIVTNFHINIFFSTLDVSILWENTHYSSFVSKPSGNYADGIVTFL
jgi:hypothetical protein